MIDTYYTCDICHKTWNKVDAYTENHLMTTGNIVFEHGAISTMNTEYTLTQNGSDFHLCANCTKKLKKALADIGFYNLYRGALIERKLNE